jgi:hypothetical protein
MKTAKNQDYTFSSSVCSSSNTLFQSLTDIEKIKQWWEGPVLGSAEEGGELRFGFLDSDNYALMYVDVANPLHTVQWTVTEDTGYGGEWIGTKLVFEISAVAPNASVLTFTHVGLHEGLKSYPDCSKGWDHFLKNLIEVSESSEKLSQVSS